MVKVKLNKETMEWEEQPNYSKEGFYLDGILKSNMDYLKKSLYNDYDFFIVVDGRERFGKSTIAAQLAYYLDPTYNLDRCVFTADQFAEAVEKADKYQAIVFDEAHGYLGSRQSMSKFNRTLIKIMSEMGSKNLIIIIVLPNFFELDKYPAIHRSSCLINVHKRAGFMFFNYKKKKDLYLKGKRFYAYNVSSNFHGAFVKYFPLDREAYQAKKDISTAEDAKINNREKKYLNQRDYLITALSKKYDLTQEQIAEFIPTLGRKGVGQVLAKEMQPWSESPSHTIILNKGDGGNVDEGKDDETNDLLDEDPKKEASIQ